MSNPCIPSTQPHCASDERGYQRIRVRQDTAGNWLRNDPILASGEFGYVIGSTDRGQFLKIGDGTLRWSQLPWVSATGNSGPPGHDGRSIEVFGPSDLPPPSSLVEKGDLWLSTNPALFSATFDPSTIHQQPGPMGPVGPSSFEVWKVATGKPTATEADYLAALKGATGDKGPKGDAGETFKVEGVVATAAALPAAPPRLTVYMTQDTGSLYIYDPLSAAKGPNDYVALGKISGPAGREAWLSTPVLDETKLPAVGSPGEMTYITSTGHLFGWSEVTKAWVDGGRIGASGLDDGLSQGQTLIWDATNSRWTATDLTRIPVGNQEGDLPTWDDAQQEWTPHRPRLGDEDNVILPTDPSDAEGAVPVYEFAADEFTVRKLSITELSDGPGNLGPLANDILAWDDSQKRWLPTTPPPGTLVDLTDVDASAAVAGDIITADGLGRFQALQPAAYTKAEVDSKVAALVTGISHEESVLDRTDTPPATPAQYDLYIVGATPTGAWAGKANNLAEWNGTAWTFSAPRSNETHLVESDASTYHWNGTAWVKIAVAASGGSSAQAGVGEIIPWVGDNFPATDYLECAGQIVDVTSYQDLYSVIGNKYNTGTAADGTTTFALPNLQGYFLRGAKAGLAVGTKQQWTTGMPKAGLTTASTGNHRHQLECGLEDTTTKILEQRRSGKFHNRAGIACEQTQLYAFTTDGTFISETGAHTHTIAGGDTETAPDHFVVKWLIRYKAINGGAVGPAGPAGPKGDIGPAVIQSLTVSAYNALTVKDPKVLYVTYGT